MGTPANDLLQIHLFAYEPLELRGLFKRGELGDLVKANAEKTFQDAAEQFLREFPVIIRYASRNF